MRTLVVLLITSLTYTAAQAQGYFRTGYYQVWDTINSTWNNDMQITHELIGPDGSFLNLTLDTLENGAWEPRKRTELGYGTHPFPVTALNLLWNESTEQWMNDELKTTTYNADTLQTIQEVQFWTGGAWDPAERYLFSYTADNLLEETIGQTWTGQWDIISRKHYERDLTGNAIVVTDETWDGVGWTMMSVDSSSFNALGQKTATDTWTSLFGTWHQSGRSEWTYDADGLILTHTRHLGLPFQGLAPFVLETQSAAGDNLRNQTFQYNTLFPAAQTNWRNAYRWIFDPSPTTGVTGGHAPEDPHVALFPNPTTGQFTLSIQGLTCPAEATVMDAQGRQVGGTIKLDAGGSSPIDLGTEVNGLYGVRVVTTGKAVTKHILLQK